MSRIVRRRRYRCELCTLFLASTAALSFVPDSAHSQGPSPRSTDGGAACRPIAGVDTLLRKGHALLLGELHGTQEGPAFVGDVACHAARARVPVTVALELPLELATSLTTVIGTTNESERRRASTAIFTSTWQDGRRSQAMSALLDTARALKQRGFDVRVIPFSADSAGSGQLRDRGMADALTQAFQDSSRLLVVLAGNLHVRLKSGTAISPGYEPAGYLLRQRFPTRRIVSLDMANDAGSAWLCSTGGPSSCGVKTVRARRPSAPWTVEVSDSLDGNGYHGRFAVGEVRASPPAIDRPLP